METIKIVNRMGVSSRRKKLVYAALAIIAAFAVQRLFLRPSRTVSLRENSFEYSIIRLRTIKQQVSASGHINPVNVVSVGAQVSGIIDKIHVDFNDTVRTGKLLAVIDKSILSEEVNSSQARMTQAEARYDLAQLNRDRVAVLFSSGYVAKVELDHAETELASARSDYISANSNHERAKINLGYADIRSPVNGVVISRDVEEGQTIASSFNAPTLFTIAEDLTKMQIEASISEADIGYIKGGQTVDFTVDAFPLMQFKGLVDQIRLNPRTEQNVVVYNVIISIDNKDGILLPGMTAFVEINTVEKDNVPSLENATLQFRPDETISPLVVFPEGSRRLQPGEIFIYKFNPGTNRVYAIKARRGITNGTFTEIISDEIKEGDAIIFDLAGSGRRRPANSSSSRSGIGGGGGNRRRGPGPM